MLCKAGVLWRVPGRPPRLARRRPARRTCYSPARGRAPARPSRQIRQGRVAMGCCGRLVRRPGEKCVLCVRERVGWQPVLREKVVNTEGSGQ